MVFKSTYELFGQELVTKVLQAPAPFKLERDMYMFLKQVALEEGWKFLRVDTVDQQGFPDVLLLRGDEYLLIEAKLLKNKRLLDVADNLNFEFGQIPFAVRALKTGINYALAVGKGNELALLQSSDKQGEADGKQPFSYSQSSGFSGLGK